MGKAAPVMPPSPLPPADGRFRAGRPPADQGSDLAGYAPFASSVIEMASTANSPASDFSGSGGDFGGGGSSGAW